MIVVDTNIIAYLYITGEKSLQAEQLLSFDPLWKAPLLWRSEFRNVLSLYLRKNILNFDEALMMIEQAERLLDDNEYKVSSTHVMQLVSSSTCSAYDCEFVALAQHLDTVLITADKKILREFQDTAKSLDSYLA
ncbi:MAG TPA: PIN domain-containing protein [Leucothrix mucor]|uniref:PIN domain-containing protein n=1 Tax=Leucothrix mucor TaxID=45248 RepID=A0A7V2SZG5_LEUMU|nr:PIN domain-containing protein [Leucothrix mucor]